MLSIVIVSYNVRYFLEQCLYAVANASAGMATETIVVDNHSSDNTIGYLSARFPSVTWIANDHNPGFAKACNQGLQYCSGDYVLFLNPDTLVAEQSLRLCVAYLEGHPQTGAVGVPMIDGRGRFLPESKRAFPSPLASLYKLTGLAALFPRSGYFNRYALGDLDEDTTGRVEVLAGAFMICRKKTLAITGGFDERFFLYGEDIDLSFRIGKAGWENHYFTGTRIVHFKGESTGGQQADYVRHFYRAMLLFFDKHYSNTGAKRYRPAIRLAIALRAALSFAVRITRPLLLPLADTLLLFLAFRLVSAGWIRFARQGVDFHVPFIGYALPLFSLVFVMTAGFAGIYDRRYRASKTVSALFAGCICTLALYALLPEQLRFSRAVVLGGASLGSALVFFSRITLFRSLHGWLGYEPAKAAGRLVICAPGTRPAMESMLNKPATEAIHYAPAGINSEGLLAMSRQTHSRELVFCTGDISLEACMRHMQALSKKGLRFLFHSAGSSSIVGSDWRSASGRTIPVAMQYAIAQPLQQRMKRVTDIVLSVLFLLTAPAHAIIHPNAMQLLANTIKVLSGEATWIGYQTACETLPPLRRSIISHNKHPSPAWRLSADAWYAFDYAWWQDIFMVFSRYYQLA
ncbi:glycosyltransferase family 2 protein [Sediminibacterium soli]|uniref:glycosyltransferase family 2 protein n=1 Tax=Sediminibacterium soli TaxID=2698829 RepID=UPI00137A0020|nr:glycosyltransferase [Sediminibacterium soli]NCI47844.1 glycosyltransferase [Sediminibacterium soli]